MCIVVYLLLSFTYNVVKTFSTHISISLIIFHYFRHSLLAASVIGEINDTFGVNLRVYDLFLNPNVKKMALLLDQNIISTSNEVNLVEELNTVIDDCTM